MSSNLNTHKGVIAKLSTPIGVIAKLNHEFGLPKYETDGASGVDLRANESLSIAAFDTVLVGTGLTVSSIPTGYELQVRPRSGISLKTNLRVANAPGTIDSDYRGEIKIIVHNTGSTPYSVNLGDRLAQLVLQEVPKIEFVVQEEVEETQRGAGGFGSTGHV